jgi:hypothetical protein
MRAPGQRGHQRRRQHPHPGTHPTQPTYGPGPWPRTWRGTKTCQHSGVSRQPPRNVNPLH